MFGSRMAVSSITSCCASAPGSFAATGRASHCGAALAVGPVCDDAVGVGVSVGIGVNLWPTGVGLVSLACGTLSGTHEQRSNAATRRARGNPEMTRPGRMHRR
jgi:hypothetical protein